MVDAHALPSQHLDLVDKYLSNFTVSPETRRWVLDIEQKCFLVQFRLYFSYGFIISLINNYTLL